MFNRKLSPEEKSVRGSLVTGLSESEVRLLDIYEGDVRLSIHAFTRYNFRITDYSDLRVMITGICP